VEEPGSNQRAQAVGEDEDLAGLHKVVALQGAQAGHVSLGFQFGCSVPVRAGWTFAVALAGLLHPHGHKTVFQKRPEDRPVPAIAHQFAVQRVAAQPAYEQYRRITTRSVRAGDNHASSRAFYLNRSIQDTRILSDFEGARLQDGGFGYLLVSANQPNANLIAGEVSAN